jgi:hypothetical protein
LILFIIGLIEKIFISSFDFSLLGGAKQQRQQQLEQERSAAHQGSDRTKLLPSPSKLRGLFSRKSAPPSPSSAASQGHKQSTPARSPMGTGGSGGSTARGVVRGSELDLTPGESHTDALESGFGFGHGQAVFTPGADQHARGARRSRISSAAIGAALGRLNPRTLFRRTQSENAVVLNTQTWAPAHRSSGDLHASSSISFSANLGTLMHELRATWLSHAR